MAFSIALDLIVAGLLLVTICYAMVLNRKIGTLRRDKAELEKMVTAFNVATTNAEKSIKKLKNSAENLGERMEKAHSLRDDLMFLTERGGSIADKLEDLVRHSRDNNEVVPLHPKKSKFDESDFAPLKKPRKNGNGNGAKQRSVPRQSDAEKELIRALQAVR